MTVYMILLAMIIFEGVIVNVKKNRSQADVRNYMILVCMELLFIAGARGLTIGADTKAYISGYRYFNDMQGIRMFTENDPWYISYEIGYMLLMKVLAFFHVSESFFLLVIAVLIYVPICKFIYDYSKNTCLSVTVFFCIEMFGYSLGIFRQMIAVGILLLSVKFIKEQNLIKYLLLVLLAICFHTTSVIFLPMYWFNKLQFKKKYLLVFIALEAFFMILTGPIISLILKILPTYDSYVNGIYGGTGGSYVFLIFLNIIIILCAIYVDKVNIQDLFIYNLGLYAMMIAALLQILAYKFVVMGRSNVCFIIFIGICLPILYKVMFTSRSYALVCFITYIFLAIYFYLTMHNVQTFSPYYFIWESAKTTIY